MKLQKKPLALAVSSISAATVLLSLGANAAVYETEHVFSVNDLQMTLRARNFGPRGTYGEAGTLNHPKAICGIDVVGSIECPDDGPQPFVDKEGITLYPTNVKWGWDVVDFLGAQERAISKLEYTTGFVGNITDEGGEVIGLKVSNAATETYRVPARMGTWCQGLGGNTVKCSTEHYTVMEHVFSCNETIPYYIADPVSGAQALLSFPNPEDGTFDCANSALDDNVVIQGGDNDGIRLTSVIPGTQMEANDNTTVLHDIAVSGDYSITLKDDGKPLYRWGTLIKRPNDLRFSAHMPLPESWSVRDEAGNLVNEFNVIKAELHVDHWITNNPNDQIRPEDLENEAATGRKPSYQVEGDGDWTSLVDCYEGDGDFIPTDEGSDDPDVIGVGTVLRNAEFALDPAAEPGDYPADDPYAFSSDLIGGYSNAWYTSINRDPFEWSYVDADEAAAGTYNFVGSPTPLDLTLPENANLQLVSGPRWRLKPNKFGQDIPGLEIPLIECSTPPFGHDNIKYEVGAPVTTVINLLDWDDDEGPSPMATTRGWVDVEANPFVEVAGTQLLVEPGLDPVPYTTNGTAMTDKFDVVVYIKGDRKPTALYKARLVIETDEPEEPAPE